MEITALYIHHEVSTEIQRIIDMKWLCFTILTYQVFGQDQPCPVSLSVDISEVNATFGQENTFVDSEGVTRGCICNLRPCLRKCCSENEMISEEEGGCVPNPGIEFDVTFYEGTEVSAGTKLEHFHLIYDMSCPENHRSTTISSDESAVRIHTNGSLFVEETNVTHDLEHYCLDVTKNGTVPLVCYPLPPEDPEEEQEVYAYAMIVSMPFLLATFVVYALLPESHSLHRKALMCYVLALLLAYISLVIPKLQMDIPSLPCHLLGYSIIFFFMVSFVWMNVMCIDMWLAFRGLKAYSDRRVAERKRFMLYNVYALVVPTLDVLIVFLMNTWGDETSKFYPGISIDMCFLKGGLPSFLYFHFPMMVFIIINCTLFVVTGLRIYRAKKEARVLKHTDSKKHLYEDDKKQFKLYIKLFFAMGINWSAEVISFVIEALCEEFPPAVSYVTDFINAAYGIVIFFIFVFKWKIWRFLVKRYYICIGKPGLARDWSTTRETRTSSGKKSTIADTTVSQLENEDERKCFELKQS